MFTFQKARTKYLCLTIVATVLLSLALPAAVLSDEDEETVDYLALAALMLRDGNLDRAMISLDQVDLQSEGLDLTRYYTLRGMTHMRRNELDLARDALLQAIEASKASESGTVDPVVYVYLAQIQFKLQDYAAVIESLDLAGAAVDRIASTYHMRAQSYWLMEDPVMALGTLDVASELFPQDYSFLRRKIFFLIDMGLFREASILGREYLAASEGGLNDYLALGNALRASGDLEEAAVLLEQAQLLFPVSAEAKKVLAHVYIDREQLSAAADLLYQAALLQPELLAEAAELYRRSGQTYRALMLNSQLSDQEQKLRQRLAIYLQLQNFEQAAAMETALLRVGLLEDEDLRYAMAYAFFNTGDFETAENYLATLNRPDLFRKAAELRRAIGDCAEDTWKCM